MDAVQLFNQSTLYIQECGAKGRGVITRTLIPARTVIDISPVLLFPSEEYSQHGQYTQLDHYTYRWKKGSMALALGLGSMFNHSNMPNVGFQRDFNNKLIRYTTLREIQPNEELCISYGPNLWFPNMEDHLCQDKNQKQNGNNSKDGCDDASGSLRSDRTMLSDLEDGTVDSFLARLQFSDSESD